MFERGAIQAVAGKDFIGEREAFGRDDQGEHELFAIGPVIAGVAAVGFGHGVGVALEISAGQIVEQQVEGRAEEILPLLGEGLFEGGLVGEQPVQTAIEPVLVGHAGIGVEQHVHGALGKPFFVDEEFAARGEESVDDQ